jgi:ribonuclease BN (tRNA processing enzyme)
VLGSSPAWPNPGEPCSSYLVEAGGKRLLLDCGTGALAALLATDPAPIDAIVLSHVHFDHVADLIPLGYALKLGAIASWPRPALHVPPGGIERLGGLCEAGGARRDHLGRRFDLQEYTPAHGLQVGAARIRLCELPHPGTCRAIRVEADGGSLVYSGDTGINDRLAGFAAGADLLMCEATMADEPADAIHLGGADAGRIATAAGVGTLILCHVEDVRRAAAVAAAREHFAGPVEAARAGSRATT